MTIIPNYYIHNVHKIVAFSQYGLGAPLILKIIAEDGSNVCVTMFTNNEELNNRLIDAITAVNAVPEKPDPAHAAAHDALNQCPIEFVEKSDDAV